VASLLLLLTLSRTLSHPSPLFRLLRCPENGVDAHYLPMYIYSYTHNMHNIEIINKGVDVLSPEDVPQGRDARQRLGTREGLSFDVVAGGLAIHLLVYTLDYNIIITINIMRINIRNVVVVVVNRREFALLITMR